MIDVSTATLRRPWRIVRASRKWRIEDADGNQLCTPDGRVAALVPMQALVDLANEHPDAKLDQLIDAALRRMIA